jgi:hypothetical protein
LGRFLPAVLVVALLGGSAAAFAVTERLKLVRSPIFGTQVSKRVSPGSKRAKIDFRLRKPDRITIAIVNAKGTLVRTLVASKRARGLQQRRWNGRDDAGVPVPDGLYKPRVHLADAHRTIVLPNPILVDTKAPTVSPTHLNLRAFSPDGDYRKDYLRVAYKASEPVRPVLYANGHAVVVRKFFRSSGAFDWAGRADGLPRPAGTYRLQLSGIDRAGNEGPKSRVFRVQIRYIALAKKVIRARSGGRIRVRVVTDAHSYRWRIGRRGGRVRSRVLSIAAGEPGRYRLVVSERGQRASALVVVRP